MTRALGLSGLSRRPEAGASQARREGQVLWIHATSDLRLSVLCGIAETLVSQRDDLSLVATYDPALVRPPEALDAVCDAVAPLSAPGGGPGRQVIQNWRPDLGIWSGGYLNGAVIRQAGDAGTRMILLDGDESGFQKRKRRWFSDPLQEALSRFSHVLANSEGAAELIRRAGLPAERIEVTRPLREVPTPPDCPDEEVAEVSRELVGRPVWMAAFSHPDEFGYIVTAHRNAVRHAHRLLLVIVLEDPAYRQDLLDLLEGMTLRHAVWHLGDPIDDQVQVLVADEPEDLGLWYRIAPQSFVGHSLVPGTEGRCPLNAAALGSAVLHGPHVGTHAEAYLRLTMAGGAQLVPDGNALGAQVARLIAPDRAARMALAGWDVATEGAEVVARITGLADDLLNEAEADRAGA